MTMIMIEIIQVIFCDPGTLSEILFKELGRTISGTLTTWFLVFDLVASVLCVVQQICHSNKG